MHNCLEGLIHFRDFQQTGHTKLRRSSVNKATSGVQVLKQVHMDIERGDGIPTQMPSSDMLEHKLAYFSPIPCFYRSQLLAAAPSLTSP